MTKLIDGGLSTELEVLGETFSGALWTAKTLIENPSKITAAHRNFQAAGASVVITSSYQISRNGFRAEGLPEEGADQALVASVLAARAATDGTETLVAASIGPFGATLHDGSEYRGNYGVSEEALFNFHKPRIEILTSAKPDILLAETIPDLVETRALARALSDSALPVWFSFTVRDSTTLWSGDKIADAIQALSAIPNLKAIGFNCVDPKLVADLVPFVKSLSSAQVVVYPNGGGVWNAERGEWESPNFKKLGDYWSEWAELGLDYVGGCCGVDAAEIKELGSRMNETSR